MRYANYADFLAAYDSEMPPHPDHPDAPQGLVCYVDAPDDGWFLPYQGGSSISDTATNWLEVLWANGGGVVVRVTQHDVHAPLDGREMPNGVHLLTLFDARGVALLYLTREFCDAHVRFLTELEAYTTDELQAVDDEMRANAY